MRTYVPVLVLSGGVFVRRSVYAWRLDHGSHLYSHWPQRPSSVRHRSPHSQSGSSSTVVVVASSSAVVVSASSNIVVAVVVVVVVVSSLGLHAHESDPACCSQVPDCPVVVVQSLPHSHSADLTQKQRSLEYLYAVGGRAGGRMSENIGMPVSE